MYDFTHQWQMEIIANGSMTDEYEVNDGVFVEGRKGSLLALRLTNNSDESVMFVPSLDGLSIYDEKPASINSNGIILSPRETSIVDRWAVSNDSLEFVGGKSFEKRSGKGTDNIGVIGCVVFRDRIRPDITAAKINALVEPSVSAAYVSSDIVYDTGPRATMNTSLSNNYALTSSATIDTIGYESYKDYFVKRDASYPDGVMTVYYDSVRGLEKRGVVMKYKTPHTPDAFPVSKGMRSR